MLVDTFVSPKDSARDAGCAHDHVEHAAVDLNRGLMSADYSSGVGNAADFAVFELDGCLVPAVRRSEARVSGEHGVVRPAMDPGC